MLLSLLTSWQVCGGGEILRKWAKFSFGSIKFKKLELLQEMEALDILKETRCLITLEVRQENTLFAKLGEIRKQEWIYWRQRSKLQWLKESDENKKFFHAVANGLKKWNFIPSICKDDSDFTIPSDISKVFITRF